MRRFAILVLLATACGPQVIVPQDDGTTGGPQDPGTPSLTSAGPGDPATSSTTMPSTTGGDVTTSADEATFGDEGEAGVDFIITPDGGGVCGEDLPPGTLAHCGDCDLFDDGWCADGYKCMPWANDGGSEWNATRCSPIARDPAQLGDPCTVMGSAVSGIDDCDAGLVCLHVDPETLEGTCVAKCGGSQASPECPDGAACAIGHQGVISLCLPPCDPLADDCAPGTCTAFLDDVLACFVDGADAGPGQPCTYPMDCAAGSTCLQDDATGGCGEDGFYCCTSLCDLSGADPNAACLPGQTCTPWYRPGSVSPPLDAIGVCTLGG